MPTGYTADVQGGKVTEFPEFAMQCARAFGALIEMRDDPHDAKIPDSFEPSDWHSGELDKANRRLTKLEAMKPDAIERAYEDDFATRVAYAQERTAEIETQKARYESMLAKAERWMPPSSEHVGLKKFMVEQLEESVKWDCHTSETPTRTDPADWHANQIAECKRSIAYHTKEHAAEVKRSEDRTRWIRQLRDSLKQLPEAPPA